MRPPTSSSAACTHKAMALTPLLYIRRSDTRCGPGFAPHQPVPTDSRNATQPTGTEAVKHAASNPSNVFPTCFNFWTVALGLRCRYCVAGTRNCSLLPDDFPQQHSQQRRERKCVGLFSRKWVKHTNTTWFSGGIDPVINVEVDVVYPSRVPLVSLYCCVPISDAFS